MKKIWGILCASTLFVTSPNWAADTQGNIDLPTAIIAGMELTAEICSNDQPIFREKIQHEFSKWKIRNKKYVESSRSTEKYSKYQENQRNIYRTENKKISADECLSAIQFLEDTQNDIDRIKM